MQSRGKPETKHGTLYEMAERAYGALLEAEATRLRQPIRGAGAALRPDSPANNSSVYTPAARLRPAS